MKRTVQAKLYCKTGQLAGLKFEIDKEATVGFDPENAISLYQKTISGKHARIYYDEKNKCYFLEDLKSRNGTFLDGVKVTQKEKLSDLQVITFARTFDFIFQTVEVNEKEKTEVHKPVLDERTGEVPSEFTEGAVEGVPKEDKAKTEKTIIEDQMIPVPNIPEQAQTADVQKTIEDINFLQEPEFPLENDEEDEPPGDSLQKLEMPNPESSFLLKIENQNTKVALETGDNLIGRGSGCDVILDYPSVSRRHATISIDSNRIIITDLGSSNHTFVEDKKIDSTVEIQPDTKIRFGDVDALLTYNEL